MFHETSARVVDWANSVLGEPVAALGSPGNTPDAGETVRITLLDARPSSVRPGIRVDVLLRYLLTATGRSEADVHRRLGQLTFAAITNGDLQVDREPLPLDFWKALGLAPRPSLVVSIVASRDRQRIDGAAASRLLASVAPRLAASPYIDRRRAIADPNTNGLNRRATDRRHAVAAEAVAG